eukprot:CAMPEP_0181307846 /NCGR_PEP_ID=MMETSP1101-20121128/11117_1 /TAXON_ID=46948 /ORGANISM="Rhodomonas abbreviata, Strain Caron Lab Isolate" /LENGTH=1058 /DNA_ID=CAMNT_0023414129 /DNA_START=71 /DNA_END=3243 /DNA_ORIENTATION=+
MNAQRCEVLAIGKVGVGKSSLGNVLTSTSGAGRSRFLASDSATSETRRIRRGEGAFPQEDSPDHNLVCAFWDTPGLGASTELDREAFEEITKFLDSDEGALHGVLCVLSAEEERIDMTTQNILQALLSNKSVLQRTALVVNKWSSEHEALQDRVRTLPKEERAHIRKKEDSEINEFLQTRKQNMILEMVQRLVPRIVDSGLPAPTTQELEEFVRRRSFFVEALHCPETDAERLAVSRQYRSLGGWLSDIARLERLTTNTNTLLLRDRQKERLQLLQDATLLELCALSCKADSSLSAFEEGTQCNGPEGEEERGFILQHVFEKNKCCVFKATQGSVLVVCFQGDACPLDWLADMEEGGADDEVLDSVGLRVPTKWLASPEMAALLKDLQKRTTGDSAPLQHTRVIFAGHARGGAYATLAALRFWEAVEKDGASELLDVRVVTFGAPLVFAFARQPSSCNVKLEAFSKLVRNYVNEADLVPRLLGGRPNPGGVAEFARRVGPSAVASAFGQTADAEGSAGDEQLVNAFLHPVLLRLDLGEKHWEELGGGAARSALGEAEQLATKHQVQQGTESMPLATATAGNWVSMHEKQEEILSAALESGDCQHGELWSILLKTFASPQLLVAKRMAEELEWEDCGLQSEEELRVRLLDRLRMEGREHLAAWSADSSMLQRTLESTVRLRRLLHSSAPTRYLHVGEVCHLHGLRTTQDGEPLINLSVLLPDFPHPSDRRRRSASLDTARRSIEDWPHGAPSEAPPHTASAAQPQGATAHSEQRLRWYAYLADWFHVNGPKAITSERAQGADAWEQACSEGVSVRPLGEGSADTAKSRISHLAADIYEYFNGFTEVRENGECDEPQTFLEWLQVKLSALYGCSPVTMSKRSMLKFAKSVATFFTAKDSANNASQNPSSGASDSCRGAHRDNANGSWDGGYCENWELIGDEEVEFPREALVGERKSRGVDAEDSQEEALGSGSEVFMDCEDGVVEALGSGSEVFMDCEDGVVGADTGAGQGREEDGGGAGLLFVQVLRQHLFLDAHTSFQDCIRAHACQAYLRSLRAAAA